jgi:hypothetical protein
LPSDQLALSYRQRGIARFQTGRADLAILDFTSAMWLKGLDDDQTTRTYYNRGLAYQMLDESKLAIADLTTAIERNPGYAEAYNSRGHVYLGLNEHEKALADFTASHTQGNPEPHLPVYGMALTYEAMGKVDVAKSWYGRVLEIKADFEPARAKLHPDDVALDSAPVPAIESGTLLPSTTSQKDDAPELRRETEEDRVLEPEAAPAFTLDADAERQLKTAANRDGEPLLTEAESQDTRPTLVDEPVPPEGRDQQLPVLEPAAPPAAAAQDTRADRAPSTRVATSVEMSAPKETALSVRQPSAAEADASTPEHQVATLSPVTEPSQGKTGAVGDYHIQLGAYASPAIAESEAMRLKNGHPDLLGSVTHTVQRASVGTKTYFRLRGTGLSRADAIRLCKDLRERSLSCVVSRP